MIHNAGYYQGSSWWRVGAPNSICSTPRGLP